MNARRDLPSLPAPLVVGTCEWCGRMFTARYGYALHRCDDDTRPIDAVATPVEVIEVMQAMRHTIVMQAVAS